MDEWLSLKDAAAAAGVNRITLGNWVRRGMLKSRTGKVRNLATVLVKLVDVRRLIPADGLKPGPRPAKPKRSR